MRQEGSIDLSLYSAYNGVKLDIKAPPNIRKYTMLEWSRLVTWRRLNVLCGEMGNKSTTQKTLIVRGSKAELRSYACSMLSCFA